MNPKSSGQGNNQSAPSDDLKIPKLGASTAPKTIIKQPGEEDRDDGGEKEVTFPTSQSEPSESLSFGNTPQYGGLNMEADKAQSQKTSDQGAGGHVAAPNGQMLSDADIARIAAVVLSTMNAARNNPVQITGGREQFAETPMRTAEMPVDRPLDQMMRSDLLNEPVDIDVVADMKHAEQLAFLEEPVRIVIHDTAEEGAEDPVPLWCNGRSQYVRRGVPTVIRRKFVERLLRAKPEGVRTRMTRDGEGNIRNHIDKSRTLKYPFSIIEDRNPRGAAWAQKIRAEQ